VPGFLGLTQRVRKVRWPLEYANADDPAWKLMRAILSTWVRESGRPVLLCPLPTFDHIAGNILGDDYRARFDELARELDVPWVDLLPILHKHPADVRRAMRFVQDEHPTPLGHELLAAAIAPALAEFVGKVRAS
jgi:lysophospholipase L1-like esterase